MNAFLIINIRMNISHALVSLWIERRELKAFMKITVSEINNNVKRNAAGYIAECEQRYHDEISSLAREIAASEMHKIVMIAGPSGSGKTTTAHILHRYLKENGVTPSVVSLDDFYLDRGNAPLDSDGKPDLETVHALDLPEINRCFGEIISTGKSVMPLFDFGPGRRKSEGHLVDITGGGVLIVEGLHALNPLLTSALPADSIYKVYISVSKSIYDDNGETLLTSRQMRLMRRMSRDDIYRGASPQRTFDMWESVAKGEKKYLYCFKDTADRIIATLHDYEPCVFKFRVLELLSQISPETEDYDYLIKVAEGLCNFCELNEDLVPADSLLREFIHPID